MLRKTIVSVVLIGLFLASAMGVAKVLIDRRPAPVRAPVAERAPLVDTLRLTPQEAAETLYGYGTAQADLQALLRAEVAGVVLELVDDLDAGDSVGVGQPLVRLDDRQYRQELAAAQGMIQAREADLTQLQVERQNLLALLEIAQEDHALNRSERDRVKGLYEQGHAAKTEYDQAQLRFQESQRAVQLLTNQVDLIEPRRMRLTAEKEADQARAEQARLNIERCTISAPFAGHIESISVDLGDRVQVGSEILRIVDVSRIVAPIRMPVSARPRTRVGAEASLQVESMPEIRWTGTVTRIAPSADERTRTFEAYVEVDNRRQAVPLLPGYFVKAEVQGPLLADALIVPRNAIVDGSVFVVKDSRAEATRVYVERYLADRAVITGNVRPGDLVILTNLDLLYDGAPVRLNQDAPTADAAIMTGGS